MEQDTMVFERREEGNLVIEGIPQNIPFSLTNRLLQYRNTRGAIFRDWGPNGEGILIGTRFAEVSQVHWVKKQGGARQQLTFFGESVTGASLCPNPANKTFIFGKDVGGGENFQLFSFNMEDGSYKMLTDGTSRNSFGGWSNKGDKFVFSTNKRNGKDSDFYLMDLADSDNAQLLKEVDGAWWARDWSPDDKYLLLGKYVAVSESYCYLLDIESGETTEINAKETPISYGKVIFNGTGKGLFMVSDEGHEFRKLFYYDLKTKESKLLTNELNWNIEALELSKDGSLLAFTANEDGLRNLYLMDTQTFAYRQLKNLPLGQIYALGFHDDNNQLGMTVNSSKSPSDVYVYDIEKEEAIRWTFAEVGGMNTDSFIEPTLIHYPTFDKVGEEQRKIPAFIYKPKKAGPHPVIINIHGGPESQFVPYFAPTFQYILQELEVAIIGPNVRGSSGYGKEYLSLDNWYLREDSVKDIGALLEWIKEQPDLDEKRVMVSGGSYGGYMVLASLIHYGDKLKGGVDRVGISNFVTFLTNTKEYRRDLRRVEYGDERDPKMRQFLEDISPTNHADKITKPLFIIQGANDPRVPLSEAEQMLERVKENGTPVWYLMAKDEGHGFRKKSNSDYNMAAYMLFIERFLLGG